MDRLKNRNLVGISAKNELFFSLDVRIPAHRTRVGPILPTRRSHTRPSTRVGATASCCHDAPRRTLPELLWPHRARLWIERHHHWRRVERWRWGGGSPAIGRGGGAEDGVEGCRSKLRPGEEVLRPDLEVKTWSLASASGGPKRRLRPWVPSVTRRRRFITAGHSATTGPCVTP
jgi:hypothetical protein